MPDGWDVKMDEQKRKDLQCSADDHNVWDGSGD